MEHLNVQLTAYYQVIIQKSTDKYLLKIKNGINFVFNKSKAKAYLITQQTTQNGSEVNRI